ncbi:MAG TPA: DUF5069 domain-containing protein [Verrucomicrobiae bacterium]|jgi:hypothetical protein|nr:DUF5069 domain-containing protein [Verrucomicrobiae bacterium]
MKTPIENRDLTKQPPHSPHDRFGGFAIIGRTVDKCKASISGKLGEYHFDCPLDNMLFGFKGITGEQFKTAVTASKNYEDVAEWVNKNGTAKSPEEIEAWSEKVEQLKLKDVPSMKAPDKQKEARQNCEKLGLDFDNATLFAWLDADDEASFHSAMAAK